MKNKRVLVTGASRGIGAATAAAFHLQGAFVVGVATKKPADSDISGSVSEWFEADFCDPGSLSDFCQKIERTEAFDVCVNNAGINIIKPLTEISREDFEKINKVNVEAPFSICRAVVPGMQSLGGGRIVNVASIWSLITKSNRSLYSTTKAALAGMTRALAVEFSSSQILINSVSPGFTMTELTKHSLSEKERAELAQTVPLGRFAMVEEIAESILFLSSERNTYITGQNLVVDGGFSII